MEFETSFQRDFVWENPSVKQLNGSFCKVQYDAHIKALMSPKPFFDLSVWSWGVEGVVEAPVDA